MTGIHRRAEDADAESRPEDYRGRSVPEAYLLAPRTGSAAARGLWLLLLPLSLVNLVHWVRPAEPSRPATASRCYSVCVRLAAAVLTVQLVATYAEISMDLVFWQCGSSTACTQDHAWLAFLNAQGDGWWQATPGRGLVLGAALPLAVLVCLAVLGRRTWRRTEVLRPLMPFADGRFDGDPGGDEPLSRPGFWYGKQQVARLRRAHIALGLCTVGAFVLIPCLDRDQHHGFGPLTVVGCCLAALVVLVAALTLFVVITSERSEMRLDERATALPRLLARGGVLLVAGIFLYAGWAREGWAPSGRLPGTSLFFGGILAADAVLVVALCIACVFLMGRRPAYHGILRGFGGPAVLLLALWAGVAFAAGQALLVAEFFDGTTGSATAPGPPAFLEASVWGFVVMLLAGAAVACFLWADRLRMARRLRYHLERDYPGEPPDIERTFEITRARASAHSTDHLPLLLGVFSGAAALSLGTSAAATWAAPSLLDVLTRDDASVALGKMLGEWLFLLASVGLVTLGCLAYQYPVSRRSVGLLWDIATFWPRAAHPFGPPCLGERTVPDLQWRATAWMRATGGRLMFSAHGQGSVWVAAAVLQMSPEQRPRVSLLTYGCPLTRIYGRYFPAYFGPRNLNRLHRDIGAWRNLWRETDPIGGAVRVGDEEGLQVDRAPLRDPLAYGRTALHPLFMPILGFDDYQADPTFAAEHSRLLARLAW
ncbi:hypothetical protein ACFWPQ_46030 [Streptomyces sp. NPDC058464]|uniref:hypothetical protein n=1 Tax=Streptomyces sp. NPDC058464 TaxID=3346511 RepID=UPI00365024FC